MCAAEELRDERPLGTPAAGREPKHVEPWLQGTLTEVPATLRAVLHVIELAKHDVDHFCGQLTEEELHARPFGLPSVAFHMRHIARSIDRLLTYAEGDALNEEQARALRLELDGNSPKAELFAEFHEALNNGETRVRQVDLATLEQVRGVGRKRLPSTVAGLLIHVADHTQRHVGQAVTTAKVVVGQRQQTGLPSS